MKNTVRLSQHVPTLLRKAYGRADKIIWFLVLLGFFAGIALFFAESISLVIESSEPSMSVTRGEVRYSVWSILKVMFADKAFSPKEIQNGNYISLLLLLPIGYVVSVLFGMTVWIRSYTFPTGTKTALAFVFLFSPAVLVISAVVIASRFLKTYFGTFGKGVSIAFGFTGTGLALLSGLLAAALLTLTFPLVSPSSAGAFRRYDNISIKMGE